MLDGLHEDLNRVLKKPYIEAVEVGERDDETVAAEAWASYLQRDRSVIVDQFQGQLKSTVRCAECSFESSKFDPFMYLTLPLPEPRPGEPVTLWQCLEAYMAEEELSGDNLWRCPTCDGFRRATKRFQLWKLPCHLVLVLRILQPSKESIFRTMSRPGSLSR